MSVCEVHAVVTGRAGRPVVALSNSLGATHRMWDAQLEVLNEHFQVVRYDTRGHGKSPVPEGTYSIDDLADDLLALLDRLGVARAHIVGLSLGGMTAMRLAARHPERVDRLAVLCTAAQLPPADAWRRRAELVHTQGCDAVAASVVERWFTSEYLSVHPTIRQTYEQMVASTSAQGYAGCCDAIAHMDLREDLHNIGAATLVIAGAEDPATPPIMLDHIATSIPHSQMLLVERAAHLANAERPDLITPALVTHLEQS